MDLPTTRRFIDILRQHGTYGRFYSGRILEAHLRDLFDANRRAEIQALLLARDAGCIPTFLGASNHEEVTLVSRQMAETMVGAGLDPKLADWALNCWQAGLNNLSDELREEVASRSAIRPSLQPIRPEQLSYSRDAHGSETVRRHSSRPPAHLRSETGRSRTVQYPTSPLSSHSPTIASQAGQSSPTAAVSAMPEIVPAAAPPQKSSGGWIPALTVLLILPALAVGFLFTPLSPVTPDELWALIVSQNDSDDGSISMASANADTQNASLTPDGREEEGTDWTDSVLENRDGGTPATLPERNVVDASSSDKSDVGPPRPTPRPANLTPRVNPPSATWGTSNETSVSTQQPLGQAAQPIQRPAAANTIPTTTTSRPAITTPEPIAAETPSRADSGDAVVVDLPNGQMLRFIRIEAGTIRVGSQAITVREDFYIAETEVPQSAFLALGLRSPSHYSINARNLRMQEASLPVSNLSPRVVESFLEALNNQLASSGRVLRADIPMLSEWQYALLLDSNATTMDFTTSPVRTPESDGPIPVATTRQGQALYGMLGNVAELVYDTDQSPFSDNFGLLNESSFRVAGRSFESRDNEFRNVLVPVRFRSSSFAGSDGMQLGLRLVLRPR